MATAIDFLLAGFTDNSGEPLASGKVYTYEAGTTTPKATYTDSGGVTPEANPVILDSNGRKQVYADGSYKLVIKTSADVTLYTYDNLNFGTGNDITFLGTTTGVANLYVATPSPAISAYTDGAIYSFKAHQTNTAAATLNISALGAKALTSIPGHIVINFAYLVRYSSGTDSFVIVNPDRGYATTHAEISALNSAGVTIVVRQPITITGNLTLTSHLIIEAGGRLTATGQVLAINGPFTAPITQVFTAVTGEVTFGVTSVDLVYSEWFGAIADDSTNCTAAIQAAIGSVKTSGGTVQFIAGNYRHTGITVPSKVHLRGINAKASNLKFTPGTGNAISLEDGTNNTSYQSIRQLGIRCLTTSTGNGINSLTDYYVADVVIEDYEIEGFLKGIYLPYGLQVQVGFGRLLGQGAAVANGVGVQLGDRTHGTPRLVNTAQVYEAYANGYHTSFVSDGSIHQFNAVTSENCTRAFLIASRCVIQASWVQANTTLIETRTAGWNITAIENYYLNGASAEQDDISSMCTLNGSLEDLGVIGKADFKGPGQVRLRFATSLARGLRFGTVSTDAVLFESSGSLRVQSTSRPLEINRDVATGSVRTLVGLQLGGTTRGFLGVDASERPVLLGSGGSNQAAQWDNAQNILLGATAGLATNSTDGFAYIPSCAGTPTGVPSQGSSGKCALVVDSTNHKLYFYDGTWRDAGP